MRASPEDLPIDTYSGGAFIEKLWENNRLTQKEAADLTGVSESNLHKLKNGTSIPGLGVIARISFAFEIDPVEILQAYGFDKVFADENARFTTLKAALRRLSRQKANELLDKFIKEVNHTLE